ncbi:MAG: tRNA (adenosine(37)-N6)-threonylcarbamoyltransferase complex transferase subunit TsaD [bacterium]|nr:tRNA (adenosine(37)-N6)-threonylcarbamoyltransferase complex transferase subunit TsaD [bacterium]
MSCYILGIETSCDETAASVVADGHKILSNCISSQIDIHQEFGGVVPELASRHHLEAINPMVELALSKAGLDFDQLDAVAVTYGPGLIGSLLIGIATATAISFTKHIPLIGINHLEGHLYAPHLEHPDIEYPAVGLIVSGGHTELIYITAHDRYELLGQTRDDAAGEAFDKVAKVMGLPYPGGPIINKLAGEGNPKAIPLPRWTIFKNGHPFDFSFSGLKTAVIYHLRKEPRTDPKDMAASFQQAAVSVLVKHAIKAARFKEVNTIILAGGVAANTALRESLTLEAEAREMKVYFPSPILCTDNAAMIAGFAYHKYIKSEFASLDLNAVANLRLKVTTQASSNR